MDMDTTTRKRTSRSFRASQRISCLTFTRIPPGVTFTHLFGIDCQLSIEISGIAALFSISSSLPLEAIEPDPKVDSKARDI